jgi:hypothetical protein
VVRLLELHLHPLPHILYWVEIRAVALADWLVCESDAFTYSCTKRRIFITFCPIQPGGPLYPTALAPGT